jgi:hypothetical protein
VPISLGRGRGKAPAFAAFSLSSAAYPLFGGTGYLLPPLVLTLSFPLDGTLSAPGDGAAMLVLPVPSDPALIGTTVFGQGGTLDAAAPQGIALTPALALVFG